MAMNLSNDEMMLLVKIYFPLAVAAERNMQNHEAEDGSLMDIKKGDIGMRYGRQWHTRHSVDNLPFLSADSCKLRASCRDLSSSVSVSVSVSGVFSLFQTFLDFLTFLNFLSNLKFLEILKFSQNSYIFQNF